MREQRTMRVGFSSAVAAPARPGNQLVGVEADRGHGQPDVRPHLRGCPVLAITRTAYDTDGTAVEINDMVLAADRYELPVG